MPGLVHQRWVLRFAMILGLGGAGVALCRDQIECQLYYAAGRAWLSVDFCPLASHFWLPCFSILVSIVLLLIAWYLVDDVWTKLFLGVLAFVSIGCLAIPNKCHDREQQFLSGVADEIRLRGSLPTILSVAEAAIKARRNNGSYFVRDNSIRAQAVTIWGRQHPDILSGTSRTDEAVVNIVYGSARGHWSIRVGTKPESPKEAWLMQISTNVYLQWLP